MRQSPAMRLASFDVEAARADRMTAAGLDDWTLRAAGFLTSRRRSSEGVVLPALISEELAELEVGLERDLPTGGAVEISSESQLARDAYLVDDDGETFPFTGLASTIQATLSHPLLRGFGRDIARADVRRARVELDAATLEHAIAAIDLVTEILVRYWELEHALSVLQIRRSAVELAREQLRVTRTAVAAGTVAPTEELAIEQALVAREQAVMLAEADVAERSLELRRLVGLELAPGEINLDPSTPLRVPQTTLTLEGAIERAAAQNPRLALFETRTERTDIEVDVAADGLRPRLDVHAGLGLEGRSEQVSGVLAQLTTLENPYLRVGLSYEQQLGRRAARGAHHRTRAFRSRAITESEEARRELTAAVVHTYYLMETAQKRVEAGQKERELAQRNLEVEETRFLAVKATNFDVLLRQDALLQAESNYVRAVVDALVATATLEALTGDVLENYHITIDPD